MVTSPVKNYYLKGKLLMIILAVRLRWLVCYVDWLTGLLRWLVCYVDWFVTLTGLLCWMVCYVDWFVTLTGLLRWLVCYIDWFVTLTGLLRWLVCGAGGGEWLVRHDRDGAVDRSLGGRQHESPHTGVHAQQCAGVTRAMGRSATVYHEHL